LARFAGIGTNICQLATWLREDGAKSFVKSWNRLVTVIGSQSAALAKGQGVIREADPQRKETIMAIGYDKPLYVLPFDHRATFSKTMFGWEGPLSREQTEQIAAVKQVIYDGFKAAVAGGVPKEHAGMLVDETFGAAILRDALSQGFITACPAEKSGRDEFDFGYGTDFARHIDAFDPTFCKVLVRYNPEGNKELNRRQATRPKQLSDHLHRSGRLYMFELLVPPERTQLQRLGNDNKAYDLRLRPALMVQAIHELQDSGVEADVWKIEGIDRKEDCQKVVGAARRAGRDKVGCIILGRGEVEQKVRQWLTTAGGVPGFIGFAVGRTTFWDPVANCRAGTISRPDAVARIAASFREWVDLFEKAR
jgi:5-dehydro-2-deoxygluconokinase